MNPDSSIQGKVYTSTFTNLSETDSDFVVQIPRKSILNEIRKHFDGLKTDVGLSKDELLTTISNCFYDNVYARKTNPDKQIKYKFTNQLKTLKRKIEPKDPHISKSIKEKL